MAADFFLCLFSRGFFAVPDYLKSFAKFAPSDVAVELAGSLLLALDLDTRGAVFEVNTGSGFVDLLTTTAAALDEFLEQGVLGDAE